MKDKYIDHYGIDSLPHLKAASENKCEIFLTSNKELLKDRIELEKIFTIKILTPEEFVKKDEKTRNNK